MGLFGKKRKSKRNSSKTAEPKSESAPPRSSPRSPSHEEEKKEEPPSTTMTTPAPKRTTPSASYSMASMAAASALAASPIARGLPSVGDAATPSGAPDKYGVEAEETEDEIEEEEGILGASLPKLSPLELAQRVAPDEDDHGHVDDDDDEEEDDADSGRPIGICAMELPPQLRNPVSPQNPVSPPGVDEDVFRISTTNDLRRSRSRPPTEIFMDPTAVPPSPMRDPIERAGNASPPEDLLLARFERESSPRNDADRLVRVVLGKHHAEHLESGAALQAIKTFAVMQQELAALRRKQEAADGDPPAILTNLTSPATTRNTHSVSTTPATLHTPSLARHSTFSPDSQHNHNHHQKELSKTRSALILAAKKCHSLEQQLKEANEKLISMEAAHEPAQPTERTTLALELRISHLEAENHALRKKAKSSPGEDQLEDLLSRLHGIPARAVSSEDRRKIREYVTSMLGPEDDLRKAQQRIAVLEERLAQPPPPSPAESSARLLAKAREDLRRKDERIAELEAVAANHNKPAFHPHALQETSNLSLPAGDRLRSLEEEHKRLRGTLRVLQDTVDL